MDDMLYILHKNGFSGKIWRLTRSLNVGLTARAKTKTGLTRVIERNTGGKQGGKLMVPMYAKTMDTAAEELEEAADIGIKIGNQNIPALIFMDDLGSMAEGYEQQERTLQAIHEFGVRHKVEWGQEKCKVMKIGTHKEKRKQWNLGERQ